MLYVFHVDTGTMLNFSVELAMDRVSALQERIAKMIRIPEDKQVLLISGGQSLSPLINVCKYSAGTDTNPIFLFSTQAIEAVLPPPPMVNYNKSRDLQGLAEASLLMPAAYETIVSRTQLAVEFEMVDKQELQEAEVMIHDQHLQQQGWAAVVANLEDACSELRLVTKGFLERFTDYMQNRADHQAALANVDQSLELLSKIPLLPCINKLHTDEDEITSSTDILDTARSTSLIDWISTQDINHGLREIIHQCNFTTEFMDQNRGDMIRSEVELILQDVHNDTKRMKEVKGLEDRLYNLDQLISGARKTLEEQAEIAQGFVINQNRLIDEQDRSVIPDLCTTHRDRLQLMSRNHLKLLDIKRRCRLCKEELSKNINQRLRWVMFVEKRICTIESSMEMHLRQLDKLERQIDIFHQLKTAPRVYAELIMESFRRRQFTNKYLTWTNAIAGDCGMLHKQEVKRRKIFHAKLGSHFIQNMFAGLGDHPPAFATEPPRIYDDKLPDISTDDIVHLKDEVPELADHLRVPEEEDMFNEIRKLQEDLDWTCPERNFLSMPRLPVMSKSDSDAILLAPDPYCIEGGSISLGDQITECAGGEEEEALLAQGGFQAVSPPNQEFLLPKSLSEELTQEMKQENEWIREKTANQGPDSQVSKDASITTVVAGTVPMKEISPKARRKLSSRFGAEGPLSPDMDTSQEFTTADFYIDESMPSSIESPPKVTTSTDTKCSLEEKLQTELDDCKMKLSVSEGKIKSLTEFVDTRLPQLKEIVNELKGQHVLEADKFNKEFVEVKDNLVSVIKSFDSNLLAEHEAVIQSCMKEKDEKESLLNEKIASEAERCSVLEDEVKQIGEQIKVNDVDHNMTLEKIAKEHKEEIGLLEEKMSELNTNHELELEVERCEYQSKLEILEREIESKETQISEQINMIKKQDMDKLKLECDLRDTFQKEKDEICDIMGKDYEEKLKQAIACETKKFKDLKADLEESLKKCHASETQKQLEEQKQLFNKEKEEAIVMTQSALVLEHTKAAEALTEQKSSELVRLREELENDLQERLAKLSSEFNREKELLVKELNEIKNKPQQDVDVQTVAGVSGVPCETQTDHDVNRLETQVQTEECEKFTVSSQACPVEHGHLSVQTDYVDVTQLSMQTDHTEISTSSMQTDSVELKGHVDQSSSGAQTDNSTQDQSSTQTDSCVHSQTAIQTDQLSHSQSSTQTDSSEFECPSDLTEQEGSEKVASPLPADASQEVDRRVAEMEARHNEEISRLVARLEREKEDAQQLKSSLTVMTGDKQTKFNEAVNRVCKEKDRVIEELRARETELATRMEEELALVCRLREEKQKAEDVKDRALALLKERELDQRQLEMGLSVAHQQADKYQQQLGELGATADMTQSVEGISDVEDSESCGSRFRKLEYVMRTQHAKISEMQEKTVSQEEELAKAQQKLMELSMSASTLSGIQDKVSIMSCSVGDLVLLCLDERLDQYIVFTVGPTLYFLHNDCLAALSLKPVHGEPRKQWLLAEITDKEYCQAKKPNNRFKVPVGTKFYRVKAKKWVREAPPSPVKKPEKEKSATASGGSS